MDVLIYIVDHSAFIITLTSPIYIHRRVTIFVNHYHIEAYIYMIYLLDLTVAYFAVKLADQKYYINQG